MKKTMLTMVCCAALAGACAGDNAEEQGARMLRQSREALARKCYDEARDTIMALRRRYPTAIEARRQAILLLDSVEMEAALDSLTRADSTDWERLDVKAKFFARKLQEDLKQ